MVYTSCGFKVLDAAVFVRIVSSCKSLQNEAAYAAARYTPKMLQVTSAEPEALARESYSHEPIPN